MITDIPLKNTVLFAEHARLRAKMGPFGGWMMPIQYEGILAEHAWCRTHACVFDICHMGEFFIGGDAETGGLNRLLTVNAAAMPEGSCRYGFMLNERGGIIDDLVVYRLSPTRWMIVVNAATTAEDAARFRGMLPAQARFEDASSRLGKLDLQGPASAGVIAKIAGETAAGLGYYRCGVFDILGEKNIISRTGYTGELGYEIYLSVDKIAELWRRLLADELVKPAGLGARDTLRLEMGYPLYGQDLTQDITPLEAGLERFVDFNKDFIGRDALMRQKEKGVAKRLVCFAADSRRSPRHGFEIYHDGRRAGTVTSGSFSPRLGCGIGMGYVDEPLPAGAAIVAGEGSVSIDAAIVERPLYKGGTARVKSGYKTKVREAGD